MMDMMEKKLYTIRFWNKIGECVKVGGKYHHTFESEEEAWESAEALLSNAHRRGAVQLDINNIFYKMIED